MKYRAALRRLCIHCRFVLRERRLFVVCSANQRHKQGQIKAKKSSD
jgi:ribosomal protein L36